MIFTKFASSVKKMPVCCTIMYRQKSTLLAKQNFLE